MVLTRLIKGVLTNTRPRVDDEARPVPLTSASTSVLNVGGGSKQIPIPQHYDGWDHLLLDIAPGPDADIVQDARELTRLAPHQFDAVYCSHNLEHYYKHHVPQVLAGFLHVLKPDGFAEIRVPDMQSITEHMVRTGMDIDDVLYVSGAGPITAHDVWYGWGKEIERSGVDFYAHKCGFTPKSLVSALSTAGFHKVATAETANSFEIRVFAFREEPTVTQRGLLGLD